MFVISAKGPTGWNFLNMIFYQSPIFFMVFYCVLHMAEILIENDAELLKAVVEVPMSCDRQSVSFEFVLVQII